eukprot:1159124-Pelagomonas_calceolata.AAC.2
MQEYWYKRNMEREEVHQAAYAAHDASRARVSNIYANTRRVAGLMTAFEDDDYKLQEASPATIAPNFADRVSFVQEASPANIAPPEDNEASPANIAPWARAELVFSQEFEEFNDYILNNADRLVKEMPKEKELVKKTTREGWFLLVGMPTEKKKDKAGWDASMGTPPSTDTAAMPASIREGTTLLRLYVHANTVHKCTFFARACRRKWVDGPIGCAVNAAMFTHFNPALQNKNALGNRL